MRIHSPPPLPMLVTGIAGVQGYNAFHHFRRLYGDQVIGIRQPSMWPLEGDGILPCNIDDEKEIDRLWGKYRFASLLNSAGSCRLKSCELDPEMAHRLNVLGTENVMRAARRHDAMVVHISIDLVFGGREGGGYRETDTPDPVTVYGAKMVEAEQVVVRTCPNASVIRISLPMGISFNGHAGAIDWITSRFKQEKPATLYFDELRTPTYTDCLNRLFERLFEKPLPGVFHAGGPRRLTLYQIGQIVNVVGGYDPDLLTGCDLVEAGPMPPRASNVTMDSTKLVDALGENPFHPWPLDEQLIPTTRDWHRQTDLFTGSPEKVHELLYQNSLRGLEVPPSRTEIWGKGRFSDC